MYGHPHGGPPGQQMNQPLMMQHHHHGGSPHHQRQGSPMMMTTMQQQQQHPAMNVLQMGQAPTVQFPGMIPGSPMLWPGGCAISDRECKSRPESDDCSIPPCYCWTRPVWYTTWKWQNVGGRVCSEQGGITPKCSGLGFHIDNNDVIGTRMSMEGRECCGVDTCYEPELHVTDPATQQPIGKIVMKMPCCACSETEMSLAKDASGNPKFARYEKCCPEFSHLYYEDGCLGWRGYRWPVRAVALGNKSPPIAYINARFHTCYVCHPYSVGIETFPAGMTESDQKLLLAMAVTRFWRSEKEQEQEEKSGRNDGNPVY